MPYKLTNNLNLPLPIVAAIANEQYVKRGDISVTTLIDSPKQRLIKNNFEYDEDVSNLIYALQGTSMHSVVERAVGVLNQDDWMSEFPMEMDYNGWKVTGTTDLVHKPEEHLYDIKNCSVWNVLEKEEIKLDWVRQTNIYAHWLRVKYGYKISKISIIAILRDWSKGKAKFDTTYPQRQVVMVSIPVHSDEKIDAYIKNRVKLHQEYEKIFFSNGIDAVPECNPKERWEKPEVWKIIAKGSKRSLSNTNITKPEDAQIVKEKIADFYSSGKYPMNTLSIEKVQGESFRCNEYCSIRNYCNFYLSGKSVIK